MVYRNKNDGTPSTFRQANRYNSQQSWRKSPSSATISTPQTRHQDDHKSHHESNRMSRSIHAFKNRWRRNKSPENPNVSQLRGDEKHVHVNLPNKWSWKQSFDLFNCGIPPASKEHLAEVPANCCKTSWWGPYGYTEVRVCWNPTRRFLKAFFRL